MVYAKITDVGLTDQARFFSSVIDWLVALLGSATK